MEQKCYAAINQNSEIVKKSTSGGVFHELAKYTLNKGGVVFGAAWNKEWLVDMKYVDKLEDLHQLMGSKYVKANTKSTFQECKQFLDEGREVLYSGTPCQIMALKKILNKEYSNLLTVAISCHGTMPVQIWKDYLKTIKRDNTEIISINMRDKSLNGWKNYNFTVKYNDGKINTENYRKNKYMKAFLCDKYLNKSCYNCLAKDNNYDIIIGDYWGVEGIHKNLDTYKGISCILVNTEKANNLLKQLPLHLVESNKDYLIKHNAGLNSKITTIPQPYSKDIFKKRIGIITLPLHTNIGGCLQAYALQKYLTQKGYEVETISPKRKWITKQLDFTKNNIKVRFIDSFSEIKETDYDILISGSDQCWRPKYSSENFKHNLLKFAENWNINKISYAASFGSDTWEITGENDKDFKRLIKEYSAISLRENTFINKLSEITGKEIKHVLDPTALLEKEVYEKLCLNISKKEYKPFIYFLDNLPKQLSDMDYLKFDKNKVEDWLACFRDCSYVITDSFHGCMFSIIFDKPFICLENEKRGLARFNSLKELFNLKNNFVNNINDLNRIKSENLNRISSLKLNNLILESKLWLNTNLHNIFTYQNNLSFNSNLKVCLVAIAKNENNYIKEWVDWHKNLGFDNIFIYDNNDINGEKFDTVLFDYIKTGYVKILNVRGKSNQQIECYNKFYHSLANNYDWVAYFDIDEFLYLEKYVDIKTFLSNRIYSKFDGIAINWKQYDDNNIISINNNYNCIDRFTHVFEEGDRTYSTYKCTKRILRTKLNCVINSSHGAIQKSAMNEYRELGTNNIRICNTEGELINNCIYIQNWTWKNAHLKHFRFKTIEEYINNKMQRGYPTLYKNCGKNLKVDDFFSGNKLTKEKVEFASKLLNLDLNYLFSKFKSTKTIHKKIIVSGKPKPTVKDTTPFTGLPDEWWKEDLL